VSQRRRYGRCGAAIGVLALLLLIGLLTEHLWWAVGAVAVLVTAWLVIATVRTSRDLDAELERSNARVSAAEPKKTARISTEPHSGDAPEHGRGPFGTATTGEE